MTATNGRQATTAVTVLDPQPENTPKTLKSIPNWVAWRAELTSDGRLNKIPVDPKNGRNGRNASSTDPATWSDFDTAVARYKRLGCHGIGFVLTRESRIVGVDLDHCRDPQTGAIEPWAQSIVDRLDSYTEITPSGTGLRIFALGELPPGGRKKGPIEMYDVGRFLTVTGHEVGRGR